MCFMERRADHAAELLVYAETSISGKDWLAALGPPKASGVRGMMTSFDDTEDVLDQRSTLQVTEMDLDARRSRLRSTGEIQCVSPEDMDLHILWTICWKENELSRTG